MLININDEKMPNAGFKPASDDYESPTLSNKLIELHQQLILIILTLHQVKDKGTYFLSRFNILDISGPLSLTVKRNLLMVKSRVRLP